MEQEGGIEDDEEGGLQAPLLLQALIDEILLKQNDSKIWSLERCERMSCRA